MSEFKNAFIYLGALYLLFFVFEKLWSLRTQRKPLVARITTNAMISAAAFGTSALFVQPVAARLMSLTDETGFGFFNFWTFPWFIELPLTIIFLDLSFYYWHRLNHEAPFLWRFHNVHHIDTDLDVTTGFRFHPGEILFSTGFRAVQVALIGPSAFAFFVHEVVFQASTLFHHSNLRLPSKLERLLHWVVVTPRMHGLHHSVLKNETNSNYSVVFSLWDRIHGSLTPITCPQNQIGVPAYENDHDNGFLQLLKTPFLKQRNYWMNHDSPKSDETKIGRQ